MIWESVVFPTNGCRRKAKPSLQCPIPASLVLRTLQTRVLALCSLHAVPFIAPCTSALLGKWEGCWFHTQGSLWFAGYVCERKDLLVNGCCNVNVPGTKQYCCDGCLSNGCCSAYEHCVSCCLQPNKVWRAAPCSTSAFVFLPLLYDEHWPLPGRFLWGQNSEGNFVRVRNCCCEVAFVCKERKWFPVTWMVLLQNGPLYC